MRPNICVLLAVLVGLGGCAHVGTREVKGPDGSTLYVSQCNGNFASMADCYELANEQCPNGWSPFDKSEGNRIVQNTFNKQIISVSTRELAYTCK